MKKGVFLKLILYEYYINYFTIFPPILERLFGRSHEIKRTAKPMTEVNAIVACGPVCRNLIKVSIHLDSMYFFTSKISLVFQSFDLCFSGCKIWLGVEMKGVREDEDK